MNAVALMIQTELPTQTMPKRPYVTVEDAKVGDMHVWERTFTAEDTHAMGKATGDLNPLHFDHEYAAKTPFARPIVHGVTTIGEISRALGMDIPGRGTIFREMNVKFKRPIYHHDCVKFEVVITAISAKWNSIAMDIRVFANEKLALEGSCGLVLGEDPLAV